MTKFVLLLLAIILVIVVTAAFWWSENNHDHILPGSEAGAIPRCGEDCSIFGDECAMAIVQTCCPE